MDSRPNIVEYYLKMLKLVASRSTCVRRQVGSIITDEQGHVLSTGYNGVPSGLPHCTSIPCIGASDKPGDNSNCLAVHAEQNAFLQCLDISKAYTIYCSCCPCFTCAKMICNTQIKEVICEQTYADERGLALLKLKGIRVEIDGKQA